MIVLITGIGGFAGSHLADYIIQNTTSELHGILRDIDKKDNIVHLGDRVSLHQADIVDFQSLFRVIKEVKPQIIFHLAGQAFVPTSFENTAETFRINTIGAINVFEATKASGISPRIVIATSGEVYGETEGIKGYHSENSIPRPVNPYAASKTSIDYIAQTYKSYEGMDIVIARPFNHTGPRQKPSFVCSSVAQQIAVIKTRHFPPRLKVGDIKPRRDFSDVRDIVRAYWLLSEISNEEDFVYNICSGNIFSVGEIIHLFEEVTGMDLELTVDEKRLRGYDIQLLAGNAEKLRGQVGWGPQIPMKETLTDLLEYWEERTR